MPAEPSPEESETTSSHPGEGYVYHEMGSTGCRFSPIYRVCADCNRAVAPPFWERFARIYQSEGWEKAEEWLARSRGNAT